MGQFVSSWDLFEKLDFCPVHDDDDPKPQTCFIRSLMIFISFSFHERSRRQPKGIRKENSIKKQSPGDEELFEKKKKEKIQ